MAFPTVVFGADGDQFKVNALQGGALACGQKMFFDDGRQFRYAQAGAVDVVPGAFYQGPIPVPDHVLQTASAAAVGARSVTLALGATAVTPDQYRDGFLVIDLAANSGFGYIYGIDSHPAVAASGSFAVPLTSSVQVAIATTANSVSLVPNTYRGVILAIATTPTAKHAGFSVRAITATQFGWLCTKGPVMCLTTAGATVVIAQKVIPGTDTGACINEAAFSVYPTIGEVVRVAAASSYSTINARLD